MKRRVPKLIEPAEKLEPPQTSIIVPGLVPQEMLTPSIISRPEPVRPTKPSKGAGYYRAPCGCSVVLNANENEFSLRCSHGTDVRLYREGPIIRVDVAGDGFFTSGIVDAQGRFKA